MTEGVYIRVHSVIPRSVVNGPGARAVVFFQGCAKGCKGCFNPESHPLDAGFRATPREILSGLEVASLEGLTVSGGEPFLQPEALLELLTLAREEYGLTTVVYTGKTIEEIRQRKGSARCLEQIDVLIDGPFVEGLREETSLARGSTNQRIHILSGAYSTEDFHMPARGEIVIRADGTVTGTGFMEIPNIH